MSEGLRVNVVPILDENEFEKLIRTANEKLSNTTFTMTGGSTSVPTVAPTVEPNTATTSVGEAPKRDVTGSTVVIDRKSVDDIEETIVDGQTKVEESQGSQKSIIKLINDQMSKFMDSYTSERESGGSWKSSIIEAVKDRIPESLGKAVGVVGIGIDIISNILDRVMRSSKILQEVWGLFDNAFTMILTPIGNIIAIEMMPMIRKMYEILGDWMSSAMDIYDKEGWIGLIDSALSVAVNLMWEALKGIGGIILDVLVDWVTSSPTWVGLMVAVGYIKIAWDWMSTAIPMMFDNIITFIVEIPTKIRAFLTEDIPSFLSELVSNIGSMIMRIPFIQDIATSIDRLVGFFANDVMTVIRNTLLSIGNVITSISEGLGNVTSGVWDWFSALPFIPFASGGIVTQPTPAIFGEAGAEAVMPLEYLDTLLLNNQANAIEMATPYITSSVMETVSSFNGGVSSTTAYNSRNAMNVYNTINVYSDNPDRVGNEVKRLLDKSVGKVLSLY